MIAPDQKASMIAEANFRDLHHRLIAILSVTLVGYDIMSGRALLPTSSKTDFVRLIT
jgi:hypothetical protein